MSAQHRARTQPSAVAKRGRCSLQDGGFTFVEVMIAISILAIVITALVGLMNMSTAMSVRAENKARLTDAISQLADRLRAMPYAEAGKVRTYVSTEGDIVMNLTVATATTGTATVKTIIIKGYSTRVDPNNTEDITIVLRSDTYQNDEEVAFEDPPIISPLVITQAGAINPTPEGSAAWGTLNITVSAKAGSAEATLDSLRVYVDSEVVGEILAPNNSGLYTISWNSLQLDETSKSMFLDGPRRVSLEAMDNLGGLTRLEQYVRLDNVPVTNTFPAQTVAATKSSTVNVIWSPIPDPDGSAHGAARYYVVLRQMEKNAKPGVYTEYSQIVNPTSAIIETPTNASFTLNKYKNNDSFEAYIYPMCPEGCNHENPYSTKYLYKKF